VTECAVCGVPLACYERCESPSCPCFGTRGGSPEMEAAAASWRTRPSVAAARTLAGSVALDHLERGAWLDMMEARGRVIDLEIEHASL